MHDPLHLERTLPDPQSRLTAADLDGFIREFDAHFGRGPVDMFVKNGQWHHIYGGEHFGIRHSNELVYLDNPKDSCDQDGAFIMLLGECRYGFFKSDANGLYVISSWQGHGEQKTRKHLILRD